MNKEQFLAHLSNMIPEDAILHAPCAELENPTYGREVSGRDGQVTTLSRNSNIKVKFEFECACNFETYDTIKREFKNIC